MAKKYFLGSVGKAEAFRKKSDGSLELAFVSKTLTDSGLNISTTKDDIRAGQGAPIQFSFYHDPSVEITLTDVLWKPEYLTAQLGAEFVSGSEDYVTDEVTFTEGVASYTKTINKAPLPCGEDYLVWGSLKGQDDWKLISYNSTEKQLSLAGANGAYCIRYLGPIANGSVKQAEINSLIIPEELYLIITAPIFAGDACAASKGKAAGHITFEVPRFQLNGAQDFTMNMSSNQTMSLAGTALSTTSEDCEANGGKLLRIIEVIDSRTWEEDVVALIVDAESEEAGDHPAIYAELTDGHLRKVEGDDLAKIEYTTDAGTTWTTMTAAVTFTASTTYKFRLISNPAIATDNIVIGA